MKTISMMAMGFVVMAVLGGGCDVATPAVAGEAAASQDVVTCRYAKTFRRATDVRVDYWTAVQLCAGIKGSLALPSGAEERQAFYAACHDGTDPSPSCWSAWTTPEAALTAYNAEQTHYAVCEIWTP